MCLPTRWFIQHVLLGAAVMNQSWTTSAGQQIPTRVAAVGKEGRLMHVDPFKQVRLAWERPWETRLPASTLKKDLQKQVCRIQRLNFIWPRLVKEAKGAEKNDDFEDLFCQDATLSQRKGQSCMDPIKSAAVLEHALQEGLKGVNVQLASLALLLSGPAADTSAPYVLGWSGSVVCLQWKDRAIFDRITSSINKACLL